MSTINTAAAIAVLAITVSVYGGDESIAAMSTGRDVYRPSCQALDESSTFPELVRPGSDADFTKPTPKDGFCVDGDGGDNPSVASYVIDAFGSQWQDYCQNASTLVEDTCGSGGNNIIVVHNCTCVGEWISVPGWGSRYSGKCQ